MRTYMLSVICALIAALSVAAQNPKKDDLDAVLGRWEKAMSGLQTYVAAVKRTTNDKALGVMEIHEGYAMLSRADKKVGIQARLECKNKAKPEVFERYIYSGNDLYEYVPANNTVRHHKLAVNGKGVVQQDAFVALVLGMTVKHAKERFVLKLDGQAPADRYSYLHVTPKDAKDRSEFAIARLAFDRTNHLLSQIWFQQANGKEVTWDFSQMQLNVQIPADYFQAKVPAGWTKDAIRTPLVLPKLAP